MRMEYVEQQHDMQHDRINQDIFIENDPPKMVEYMFLSEKA